MSNDNNTPEGLPADVNVTTQAAPVPQVAISHFGMTEAGSTEGIEHSVISWDGAGDSPAIACGKRYLLVYRKDFRSVAHPDGRIMRAVLEEFKQGRFRFVYDKAEMEAPKALFVKFSMLCPKGHQPFEIVAGAPKTVLEGRFLGEDPENQIPVGTEWLVQLVDGDQMLAHFPSGKSHLLRMQDGMLGVGTEEEVKEALAKIVEDFLTEAKAVLLRVSGKYQTEVGKVRSQTYHQLVNFVEGNPVHATKIGAVLALHVQDFAPHVCDRILQVYTAIDPSNKLLGLARSRSEAHAKRAQQYSGPRDWVQQGDRADTSDRVVSADEVDRKRDEKARRDANLQQRRAVNQSHVKGPSPAVDKGYGRKKK